MAKHGYWTFQMRPYRERSGVWNDLRNSDPVAGLYHGDAWLTLLTNAFGLNLVLATIERGSEVRAGCVLARSRNPFARKLIALPFSDACPPLSTDQDAVPALLSALRDQVKNLDFEIRGLTGPERWETVECFQRWSIDLSRPESGTARKLEGGIRRKLRRAREAGVDIISGNSREFVDRYYALHSKTRHRLGIPSQRLSLFTLMQQIFSGDAVEIWLAVHKGADVAGLLLIRDHDQLHYKWGARLLSAPNGTQHLLTCEVVDKYVGKLKALDLGRADVSNAGLTQFKREVGGVPSPLPYAFYPRAPRNVSAEALTGTRKALSNIWKRLPSGVANELGGLLYPYLS
jgi:Acetyltransferase (GNAT) domain